MELGGDGHTWGVGIGCCPVPACLIWLMCWCVDAATQADGHSSLALVELVVRISCWFAAERYILNSERKQ